MVCAALTLCLLAWAMSIVRPMEHLSALVVAAVAGLVTVWSTRTALSFLPGAAPASVLSEGFWLLLVALGWSSFTDMMRDRKARRLS